MSKKIYVEVQVQQSEDKGFLPWHEEIGTFENGRVIRDIASTEIIFIFENKSRFSFSIQKLGESVEGKVKS